MVRTRVRIRFRKAGYLRLIGHRDLVRTMERVFRRAELRLGMSEGFHPKPRMSFPSALGLGIAGLDEVMELELAEDRADEEILRRLSASTVPGLDFVCVERLPEGTRKARLRSSTYEMPIPPEHQATAERKVAKLSSTETCPVARPRGGRTVDPCRSLEYLGIRSGKLAMRLAAIAQGGASPRDVLQALQLQGLEFSGQYLTRIEVELQS